MMGIDIGVITEIKKKLKGTEDMDDYIRSTAE